MCKKSCSSLLRVTALLHWTKDHIWTFHHFLTIALFLAKCLASCVCQASHALQFLANSFQSTLWTKRHKIPQVTDPSFFGAGQSSIHGMRLQKPLNNPMEQKSWATATMTSWKAFLQFVSKLFEMAINVFMAKMETFIFGMCLVNTWQWFEFPKAAMFKKRSKPVWACKPVLAGEGNCRENSL